MASTAALRGLAPTGYRACWRCLAPAVNQIPVLQRRHLTLKKKRAKYGPKYQAKIDAAQEAWQLKADKIESGEAPCLWDIFEERGYIKDTAGQPDAIRNLMIQKRIAAYVGIDPTAPSLHLGHLLPLMPLFWMYMHGYGAITLVGGATAKIGDPTGRLQSRDPISGADMTMNLVKIHYQLKKLWINVEAQARRYGYEWDWAWRRGLLQNSHWWNRLPMMDVLQRLGKGMRIGPMLSRDTVKRKMTEGDGVSFAEFAYPLMQAWDWWHMYQSQGVQMQIGGSDQYGNIVTGIDAFKIIRDSEPDPAMKLPAGPMHDPVGFTVPLLTDSSGVKFGKSAGNALWLDKAMTASFDLYGYLMRRPDADMESLLKLFTFMPTSEVQKIMAEHNSEPSKRVAQHALAYEVLTLVHGEEMAKETQTRHRAMYAKRTGTTVSTGQGLPEEATSLEQQVSPLTEGEQVTLNNAPPVDLKLPQSLIDQGKIARILYAAGLVESISAGQRLASKKGAYVGASPGQGASWNKGMLLTQIDFTPVALWFPQDTKNFIIGGKYLILRRGQHNLRIIEIVSDEEWKQLGLTYPGEPGTGKVRKLRAELSALKEAVKKGQTVVAATSEGEAQNAAAAAAASPEPSSAATTLEFPERKPHHIRNLEGKIKKEQEMMRAFEDDFPEMSAQQLRQKLKDDLSERK